VKDEISAVRSLARSGVSGFRVRARLFSGMIVVLSLILAVAPAAFSQSELVRWDIISVAFATPPAGNTISPGGVAFAKTVDGLKIKLTGLGTSQRGFGVSGNSLDLAKYAW